MLRSIFDSHRREYNKDVKCESCVYSATVTGFITTKMTPLKNLVTYETIERLTG